MQKTLGLDHVASGVRLHVAPSSSNPGQTIVYLASLSLHITYLRLMGPVAHTTTYSMATSAHEVPRLAISLNLCLYFLTICQLTFAVDRSGRCPGCGV